MKQILALVLSVCLLAGCAAKEQAAEKIPSDMIPAETVALVKDEFQEIPYTSRFDSVTQVMLSDNGISVDGAEETDTVYISHDIVYYE